MSRPKTKGTFREKLTQELEFWNYNTRLEGEREAIILSLLKVFPLTSTHFHDMKIYSVFTRLQEPVHCSTVVFEDDNLREEGRSFNGDFFFGAEHHYFSRPTRLSPFSYCTAKNLLPETIIISSVPRKTAFFPEHSFVASS